MTKFQQTLERGHPLVLLLDFEMFDSSGALVDRHGFSMNWYAESDRQFDNRLMDLRFMLRLVGDFGASGLAELTEWSVRLDASEPSLTSFRTAVDTADRVTVSVRATAGREVPIPAGRFEVVRLNDEPDGALSVDLDLLDRSSQRTRIPLQRYLGLGQALDGLRSAAVEVAADPKLDVSDGLTAGAWIQLQQIPTVDVAYLFRRFAGPTILVMELGVDLNGHLFAALSTDQQTYRVTANDLDVPLGEWVFVEMIWDGSLLTCRLDGQGTAALSSTAGSVITGSDLILNWASSFTGLVAEFRFASQRIVTASLDRRARRRLEDHEIADYSLYFTFDGLHILDDHTVFDLSASGLDGKAREMVVGLGAFEFVASATGTRETKGGVIPRAIGAVSMIPGTRVSVDGRWRRFCESAWSLRVSAGSQPLWLKFQQTLEGILFGPEWVFALANPAEGDLSTYQPFQTIRLTRLGTTQVFTLTVTYVRADLGLLGFRSEDRILVTLWKTWLIETTDPGSWDNRTLVGDSGQGTLRVLSEEGGVATNFFLASRVGQRMVVPDPDTPGETRELTIAEPAVAPYDLVRVAEPIWDGPALGTITLLEYFDAEADLDTGTIQLTSDVGEVLADVVAECQPTPRGMIEHLLGLAGQAPPDLSSLADDRDRFGVLVTEEATAGDLLAIAARSIDAALWSDLASGDLRWDELTPPAVEPDIDLLEVIAIQRVDQIEPFGALELTYRQHGESGGESLVVPQGGATLRTSTPGLETYYQDADAAETRAQKIFDLRKGGQEIYSVDVPLRYFRTDLAFQTVRPSGSQQLADRTWRVIGLGVTAPGLCRLLLWRNLS